MCKVQDYLFPLPPSALLQCCWCTCEIIIIREVLYHINRSHMWLLIRQGLTIRFNVQFVSLRIFLSSEARSFSYVNGRHYLPFLWPLPFRPWSAHNLFSHFCTLHAVPHQVTVHAVPHQVTFETIPLDVLCEIWELFDHVEYLTCERMSGPQQVCLVQFRMLSEVYT